MQGQHVPQKNNPATMTILKPAVWAKGRWEVLRREPVWNGRDPKSCQLATPERPQTQHRKKEVRSVRGPVVPIWGLVAAPGMATPFPPLHTLSAGAKKGLPPPRSPGLPYRKPRGMPPPSTGLGVCLWPADHRVAEVPLANHPQVRFPAGADAAE
jgi:hypothetical protein